MPGVTRRLQPPRPTFDWTTGKAEWVLHLPPHGVNQQTRVGLGFDGHAHQYKASESKLYVVYVQSVTGGWVPPPRTPLAITLTFALHPENMLRLDVDKWGAVVSDAVVGTRGDAWIFDYRAVKQPSAVGPEEESVHVRVEWQPPVPKATRAAHPARGAA